MDKFRRYIVPHLFEVRYDNADEFNLEDRSIEGLAAGINLEPKNTGFKSTILMRKDPDLQKKVEKYLPPQNRASMITLQKQ